MLSLTTNSNFLLFLKKSNGNSVDRQILESQFRTGPWRWIYYFIPLDPPMKSAFIDLFIADGNNIRTCVRNIKKSNIHELEARIDNYCNAIEEYNRKLSDPASVVVKKALKKGIRIAEHLLYVATNCHSKLQVSSTLQVGFMSKKYREGIEQLIEMKFNDFDKLLSPYLKQGKWNSSSAKLAALINYLDHEKGFVNRKSSLYGFMQMSNLFGRAFKLNRGKDQNDPFVTLRKALSKGQIMEKYKTEFDEFFQS
ncbi:MAG: hypothetical protein ABJF04_25640 [Reichenbachiella sp.]|uniref:hypothetical protein n=1 Tax=Reichenbachiella sp. TaxID=2184521 RepID=UPI0032653536